MKQWHKMTFKKYIFLLLMLTNGSGFAQDIKNEPQLFRYAVKLQDEAKWNDALTIFKNLLKTDSSNIEYLWRTSYIYARLGYDQPTEEAKQKWYQTAGYLGKKAVTQFPQNAWAHYAYAVSLGRMNENAGSKTKINNAKIIKSEAETAIKLDPKIAGPYHIMGRWHRVVAGFNGIERAMIKAIFGGMPGGSYEDAIKNFEKAILLEPLNGIHYFELANTYVERNKANDKAQAKTWLMKELMIPVKSTDDAENKKKCEDLLKKLK